MRLEDLFESKSAPGTYVAAKLDTNSRKLISDFIRVNKIPNPVLISKLHCTLIHSKVGLKNFECAGKYKEPIKANVSRLEVWTPDGKPPVLVLKLQSDGLSERHHEIMKKHPEAVYKFRSYRTHVTLSYDAENIVAAELPDFKSKLVFDREYTTKLENKNYAKLNTKKT